MGKRETPRSIRRPNVYSVMLSYNIRFNDRETDNIPVLMRNTLRNI